MGRFVAGPDPALSQLGEVLGFVHKDIDHITRTFAETLAPYLQRDYDRLAAAWAD